MARAVVRGQGVKARLLNGRGPLDLVLGALAIAAAVGVLVVMASRLHYGVDFKDEAYYAAVSYRFVLGDRPFVDEMNFLQLPAMLTFPLVKAYVAATGGTSGLILFMREMWLLFAVVLAAAGFALLRTLMRWEAALIASLLPLVAVPFNIPSLSYNSMSAGLLALGMVVGAWAAVHGRSRRWLLAAGLLHGLAVFAYPTLAVAVFAYAAALGVLYRRRAAKALVAYLGGAAAAGAVLAAIVLAAGVPNALRDWHYMTSLAGYAGGGAKIVAIGQHAGTFFARQPLFLAALVLGVVLFLTLGERGRWALLLPVVAVVTVQGLGLAWDLSMYAITLYGLVGVALGVALRGRPVAQRLYVWGVLPALFAGCVTAYTSTNGFTNAAVGFYPALFATSGVLALVLPPSAEARRDLAKALVPWALAFVFAATVFQLARFQRNAVYHDVAPKYLQFQISAGPFAGLNTTYAGAAFDAQLRQDVARYVRPGQTVLFFDDFPAGYLYSKARPAANALWLSDSDNRFGGARHPTLLWWQRTGRYPDVAFRYTYRVKYARGHFLKNYIATRYHLEKQGPRFQVWVRADR